MNQSMDCYTDINQAFMELFVVTHNKNPIAYKMK